MSVAFFLNFVKSANFEILIKQIITVIVLSAPFIKWWVKVIIKGA